MSSMAEFSRAEFKAWSKWKDCSAEQLIKRAHPGGLQIWMTAPRRAAAADLLGATGRGNEKALQTLCKVIQKDKDGQVQSRALDSMAKIAGGGGLASSAIEEAQTRVFDFLRSCRSGEVGARAIRALAFLATGNNALRLDDLKNIVQKKWESGDSSWRGHDLAAWMSCTMILLGEPPSGPLEGIRMAIGSFLAKGAGDVSSQFERLKEGMGTAGAGTANRAVALAFGSSFLAQKELATAYQMVSAVEKIGREAASLASEIDRLDKRFKDKEFSEACRLCLSVITQKQAG